jgi:hypothetical protein
LQRKAKALVQQWLQDVGVVGLESRRDCHSDLALVRTLEHPYAGGGGISVDERSVGDEISRVPWAAPATKVVR